MQPRQMVKTFNKDLNIEQEDLNKIERIGFLRPGALMILKIKLHLTLSRPEPSFYSLFISENILQIRFTIGWP